MNELFTLVAGNELSAYDLSDEQLESFFGFAIERYRALDPVINDDRFDHEFRTEMVNRFGENHPLLGQVEAEPKFGQLVRHTRPMLSTEKSYSSEDREAFAKRLRKAATEIGQSPDAILVMVTPKLDGLSGVDENGMLLTRGTNGYGSDVTRIFDRGVVAVGGRGLGVGEIVMDQRYFLDLKARYPEQGLMHPRNVVGGIVRAETIRPHAQEALDDGAVMFVPYSELKGWVGTLDQFLDDFEAIQQQALSDVPCLTDGIVIEAIDEELKHYMGHSSHHHLWQIACKTQGETAQVKVTRIQCQTGRQGLITPVVHYEPVELAGAVLSKATGHHMSMLRERSINVGAVIEVVRSGEVIPKIERVIEPADEIYSIEHCPSCGTHLVEDGLFLRCPSGACPAQASRSFEHFFKGLHGIKGFGGATCDILVSHGITNLIDLYQLGADDFYRMDFGRKQSENLRAALDLSLTTPIEEHLFLGAFGIEGLGRGDSRHLLDAFTFDELPDLSLEQIVSVDGFGERKAEPIIKGIEAIWSTVQWLRHAGLQLIEHPRGGFAGDTTSPISGKCVVFTGTMKHGKRSDMEQEAKQLGATVQSSVNKKTNYLVCGEKVGATKTDKATKLGVQLLTEDEYLCLIEPHKEAA